MGFYLENNNKKDCYSCTACENSCPQKCIKMYEDKKDGYYYPKIDESNCIKCGKCKKICIKSNSELLKENIKKAYILFRKDEQQRKTSASGGISALLMEAIIHDGGIVYGAKFDNELNVVHSRATTLKECENFKTSKYVKSNINNIFKEVIRDLTDEKLVLFTGVPCEIGALKRIIPSNFQKKLILCEIMCDSSASPILFNKFKKTLEVKYKSKINKINFRSKEIKKSERTMEINFKNGKTELLASNKNNLYSKYIHIFGSGLSAPYACTDCEFEDIDRRASDITLGDYNGKIKFFKNITDKSLILINSKKGLIIFEKYIKNHTEYLSVSISEALEKNHIKPKRNILNKDEFMNDLSRLDFNQLSEKYVEKYKYRRILGKIIPEEIKEFIKARMIKYDKKGKIK